MKKGLLLLALLGFSLISFGQIIIDFEGTGAAATIDNVLIENLTNGSSITVQGSDSYNLTTGTLSLNEIFNGAFNEICAYPNPTYDKINVLFNLPNQKRTTILISDVSGRILSKKNTELQKGLNRFSFTPNFKGIYFISIYNDNFSQNTKVISLGTSSSSFDIEFDTTEAINTSSLNSRDSTDFSFSDGDRIKLTAVSGDYSTIIVDEPTSSKTYSFGLVACTDIDGNNYPVVYIDTQVWMAKNLRVTHYPNGAFIPNITDDTEWQDLDNTNTDDAYCLYDNDVSNGSTYGALYTYAAAIADDWEKDNTDNQGVCPNGWHLPTALEWNTLVIYEDSDGGSKLADNAVLWTDGALVQNTNFGASGFSGLPAGLRRNANGSFLNIGNLTLWWSATENSTNNWKADHYHVNSGFTFIDINPTNKNYGFSLRCVKN